MKKNYTKQMLMSFLLLWATTLAFGQGGSISGRVVDSEGNPLPRASLSLKGTNQQISTNEEGEYLFSVISQQEVTIVVSFIGYQTIERLVQVTGDVVENFTLAFDFQGLSEVVVVGYGTQQKKDLTGSITSVTTKDFNKGPATTPEQLIMGKVAGVQVTSNGGAPGAGSRIRVRGGSSLSASNDPLIVIDGVPLDNNSISGVSNPLSMINPNDIESFNILKDASAAAIYGSRAANGVVLITTKRGRSDDLQINLNTRHSLGYSTGFIDVLTADQMREVVNTYPQSTDAQKALLGTANTDWQKEIFQQAYSADNNISFTGGIKNLPYRLSLGYLHQDGILKTSNLKRTSGALNLSPRFLDNHLKVDVNLKGSISNSRFADQGAIAGALRFDPTQPVHTSNSYGDYFEWLVPSTGEPNPQAPRNPLALLELRKDLSTVQRSIGNMQFDYSFHFLPELRANLNLGYDISRAAGTIDVPAFAGSAFARRGQRDQYEQNKTNKLLEGYLNYTKELVDADSRIDATLGYSYQDWIRESPTFPSLSEDGSVYQPAGVPFKTQNTLISVFGRVNYSYKDRYLLTATLRRDGSSRFSQNNRWGTFPSLAFAWRISEEDFLNTSSSLSDLKLRLGYGVTGQQEMPAELSDYPYLPGYTQSDSTAMYQFGNDYYISYRPNAYDENIKWEETATYNAGLDFGFLEGRISGSVDYFLKKTKDLLSVIPIPVGSNFSNQIMTNVGDMQSTGFELTLNANPINTSRFRWDAGFNLTWNKINIENLTKVDDPNYQGVWVGGISGGTGNTMQIHSVGYSPFSFFAYRQVYDGNGNPLEDVYEDRDGNGIINENDRYRYQSPEPRVFLGFNSQFAYDKLSFGFSLRANLGNYMYNNIVSNYAAYREILNPNGFLTNGSTNVLQTHFFNNQYLTDYYIENASFLRMDNAFLNYDVGRIGRGKTTLQVGLTVQNVFVITKYSGLDPEIAGGIDNNFYPRPRTFELGLNLNF